MLYALLGVAGMALGALAAWWMERRTHRERHRMQRLSDVLARRYAPGPPFGADETPGK